MKNRFLNAGQKSAPAPDGRSVFKWNDLVFSNFREGNLTLLSDLTENDRSSRHAIVRCEVGKIRTDLDLRIPAPLGIDQGTSFASNSRWDVNAILWLKTPVDTRDSIYLEVG